MKIHRPAKRCISFLLALSLLALVGCGGKTAAATMYLMRALGQVSVSDKAGKDVALLENLGLYSGYGVDTSRESYAWISLNDGKLAKLDQESEIAIQKEGKKLEIEIKSGSLFFNVTEPLGSDETMKIRTSNMSVSTQAACCGWVEAPDGGHMNLYLLEGRAECSTGAQTSQVIAGEMAAMTDGGQLEVQPFGAQDVPAFVLDEIEGGSGLAAAILESSGPDVLNPEGPGEEPAAEPEEPESPADPVTLALEQYRIIVSQADSYDYSSVGGATGYFYALVQMQPGDAVPTLLLEQDTENYLQYARVFQYDPENGTVHQPADSLMEGAASAGGFRGGLSMMGDGNGIQVFQMSSGSGQTYISRATLAGDALVQEDVWSGRFDLIPDAMNDSIQIDWHDVSDLSALDSWTPNANAPAPQPEQPAGADDALPTDGDRIVFRGVLDSYSYDEVVTLQGSPDPNAGWSDTSKTFWLIIPEPEQSMNLCAGDGDGYWDDIVDMIDVSYTKGLDELKQYAGQEVVFSIDPNMTYWPSDTSMPVGRPYAGGGVRVLQ